MKAILISIKPKWVAKILNGEKTIEIRKTKPNVDLPIDVYIYCTKGDVLEYFYDTNDNFGEYITHKGKCWEDEQLNGKVVAKFTLNKAEEIKGYCDELCMTYVFENQSELLEKSCLDEDDLGGYLKMYNNNDYDKVGYAWHISNLVIFDIPRELSEFKHIVMEWRYGKYGFNKWKEYHACSLTKAPQSFCYCEIVEKE